jgi:hypothetical protein
MDFFPMELLPLMDSDVREDEEGEEPGIVLLDDMDGCDIPTQSAAKALVNNRVINKNRLSINAFVVCTANGIADPMRTNPLSKAFTNRCVELFLRPAPNAIEFLQDKIQEMAQLYSKMSYTEYEESAVDTLRSRDMAHWLMMAFKNESVRVKKAVLAGCVGSEMGDVLLMVAKRKVSLDEILADPERANVKVEIDDFHMLNKELNKLEKTLGGRDTLTSITPKIRVWLDRLPANLSEHKAIIEGALKIEPTTEEMVVVPVKKRRK